MTDAPTHFGFDRKQVIHTFVILLLMLGFGFLPPFGTITPVGMQVLGIFIGCIYAWTVGIVIWPSLFALLCMGFVGKNTVGDVITATVGNTTLHMIFVSLMFCYAVEKSGLIELVAKLMLSRKFARRGPWSLCLAFWIATAVTSGITTATTAITLLCWQMFYEVANRIGLEKRSPYVSVVIIGIGISAYLGGIVLPYTAFTQICFGVLNSMDAGVTINITAYVLTMIVLNVLAIVVLYLFSSRCLHIHIDYEVPHDLISVDDLKMGKSQRTALIFIIALCLTLMLPYYLPAAWGFTKILKNLGFVGAFSVSLIILTFCRDNADKPMFDFVDAFKNGVPYGMVCLVATALLVSSKLTDPSTGVSAMITALLQPIMGLHSSYLSMALLMLFGFVLTNIINNIVCITLMVPVGVALAGSTNANPAVMITLFCMVLLQGIVMPSSSMFGALLHGNTEWLTSRSIYKYATILELVLGLVIGFIGVPIANFIFGLF